MIRWLIRVVGTAAILALLPATLVLTYWLTAAVWVVITPDDEGFAAAYRYEPWVNISGWVVWLLVIAVFALAIRSLFRLTRSKAPKN